MAYGQGNLRVCFWSYKLQDKFVWYPVLYGGKGLLRPHVQ